MNSQLDDITRLGDLGDSLSWAYERALRAYARAHPEDAKQVRDALESGTLRWRIGVVGGGGRSSEIVAEVLDHSDTARLIARMSVTPFDLN